MTKTKVTVVIPTREFGGPLRRCVQSIEASSYPQELIEILIVDDGSQRDAVEWFHEAQPGRPGARVIRQEWGGPAAARNRGIESATGELVAFTDDDCVVDRHWLREMVLAMDDQSIAGVGGRVRATDSDIVSKYMDHVHALDPVLLPSGEPWYLVTANCCFRRDSLSESGGFDPQFKRAAAEDVDLSLRLSAGGKRLKFQPSCLVYHSYESSLESFAKRFHRYGLGNRLLFEKHRVWREWPPDAAGWLWGLLNNFADDVREFVEVREFTHRLWFSFLEQLNLIMFMTGYCRLGKGSDLGRLRGQNPPLMERADFRLRPWGGGQPNGLRALASLLAGEGTGKRVGASLPGADGGWVCDFYEYAKRNRDQRLWLVTATGLLDLDDLLLMVGHHSDYEPSVPDDDLDVETRDRWQTLHDEQEAAYGKRCAGVLGLLEGGFECLDLPYIQAVCDSQGLELRRFFTWRERIMRNESGTMKSLGPDEQRSVAELLRQAGMSAKA
jgi:GT2 family glycosyltransferase